MPTYPRGPRLLKGALVTFADPTSSGNVIRFQYNPSSLRRAFKPQYVDQKQGYYIDAVRFKGAPTETISVTIQMDAIDQLEAGVNAAVQTGIHPQLAALELLVSPSVAQIQQFIGKLEEGTMEIVPILAPVVVFIFGVNRVVPVRVNDVSVEEETHDAALNPIRATVNLSMDVLTYSELDPKMPGFQLYMNYQKGKERLAAAAFTSLAQVTGEENTEATFGALESL